MPFRNSAFVTDLTRLVESAVPTLKSCNCHAFSASDGENTGKCGKSRLTAEFQLVCSTGQVTQTTARSPFDCAVDAAIMVVDSKDRK